MRVKNVSGVDKVIAATGEVVPAAATVDVDDELGGSLCDQPDVWQRAERELFDDDDPVEGDA